MTFRHLLRSLVCPSIIGSFAAVLAVGLVGPPASAQQGDRSQAFEEGIDEVRQSGILQSALNVGDHAADFELPDANGNLVKLSELLANGPVVLSFYRGGWCPYCNRQLQAVQQALPQIREQGGQMVAVAPELPDNVKATQEKNSAKYTMLSDKGNAVAREYGIVFRISDKVIPFYDQFFDIEQYNGDRSYELPLAATFVIDPDGVIRYAFLDADYKQRAEPAAIVAALAALQPAMAE
jgi:peroxiredoxin